MGGFFLAALGLGFTAWLWWLRGNPGVVYRQAAFLFPAVAVIGLGLVIFPGTREKRLGRGEEIAQLQGVRLITPRWWVILALSLAAGAANVLLLRRG